ncbi:MAG: glutamate--cysteine ligase [Nocardioides sp.]|uniref:carboxylate-amine ligase n=1 Tax=Nocardioides sp. TaxID=35761 RepID=UPI0039E725C5
MVRTVGVEEEFLLVRGGSPLLAPEGEFVVAAAEAMSHGQFEHEFKREQAELGSAPHRRVVDLRDDLRARRRELATAAEERGVRLIASATSPLDDRNTTTTDQRYERMADTFGRVAKTQLTCGMHVHVSIESEEEGVAVLDRIRAWTAVLIALSANSAFVAGEDTLYASYRTLLWGQWPSAGVTDPFETVEGYHRSRQALIDTGAAIDDGMVYFDARLSATYPTVEIRVCDVCADVDDAAVIAALARALVSTAAAEAVAGVPVPPIRSELLRVANWRAARWGAEGTLVDTRTGRLAPAWDVVSALVEHVSPALRETGDEELVADGLSEIRRRGSGARLQREAFAERGIVGVVDVLVQQTATSGP